MTTVAWIALIGLCVLLAGYYAGTETGFYRLNRVRLRFRVQQGSAAARRLDRLVGRPHEFVITTLVGNNLFVYLATLALTGLYEPVVPRAEFWATMTLAPVIFLFGEVLQKEMFRRSADVLMYRATWMLTWSKQVFRPVVFVLKQVQRFWGMFIRGSAEKREQQMERQRLYHFISESAQEGMLSSYQKAMAANIMRLQTLKVARVMRPREAAVTLHVDHTFEQCREIIRNSPYRRLPVAESDGTFVGVANVIDVLAHRHGPFDVCRYVRLPSLFMGDTNVIDALHRLRHGRQPMGFVQDDSGAVVGLITIKDLVEEIVGELGEW